MSKGRILLLTAVALAMLVTAILTWGSIGSATLIFCLILMGLGVVKILVMDAWDDYDDYRSDG